MRIKKKSIAYTYGDNSSILNIPPYNKQIAFLTSLVLYGEVDCGVQVPKKPIAPSIWVIGTDKRAIKKEINRMIDNLFECYKEEKTNKVYKY